MRKTQFGTRFGVQGWRESDVSHVRGRSQAQPRVARGAHWVRQREADRAPELVYAKCRDYPENQL